MLHVQVNLTTVAYITKQPRIADGHIRETPWLLLYVRGRIERFATEREARVEARKSWPGAVLKRV